MKKLTHHISELKPHPRFGARNISGDSLSSTAGPQPPGKFRDGRIRRLFRRISPEQPSASIVPILNQWVGEGETVNKSDLVNVINELRHYKRYNQALELNDRRTTELLVKFNFRLHYKHCLISFLYQNVSVACAASHHFRNKEMAEELQTPTNPNSLNNHTKLSTYDDDDDDPLTLSSHALAALKEFLAEQSQSVADDPGPTAAAYETDGDSRVALVAEDWRLSQFWYDRDTAETLAREVHALCRLASPESKSESESESDSTRVACIACPTLYAYLKNVDDSNARLQLLEYDKRFEQYGSDFTFYDYNQPEELPLELKHAFHVVIADPPYLSKECLEKVAQTISFLARSKESYLLLLTGEVQRERAAELLGLHPCGFRPRHSSKLGNEFRLFTNYDPETRLGGWEREK